MIKEIIARSGNDKAIPWRLRLPRLRALPSPERLRAGMPFGLVITIANN